MPVQDELPKSRLTIRYKTEVNGEPADIELPLRFLLLGDMSLGSSKDRKLDLEERRVRNLNGTNTAGVMTDMGVGLDLEVPNRVDPENAATTKLSLKFNSMRAFSPAELANQLPKVRALLLIKKLLGEIDANIANTKTLRKMMSDLYASADMFKKVQDELKSYDSFKIPAAPKKA